MMSDIFEIKEHTLECQHIREYARATANSREDVLKLAIKQYTPLDNLTPQEGDITIIGTHANGFPKELYEPLWEDIHARSKANGFRIRSIWMADVAHQGSSGVLNEELLGNDPSWFDHPRDLLHMINHFRTSMPQPIVGIGHSFGGNILCNLALIHPRLLSTIVFLDPVIQRAPMAESGPNVAQQSTFRRDFWPSRSEAEASFRKQKFFQEWDPRVLDRWCKYGIRETPSSLYPDEKEGGVTLTTTKHQECMTFLRPSWEAFSEDGKTLLRPELVPDIGVNGAMRYPFYRPEPAITYARIEALRPSALYIFGGTSPMSPPDARKHKVENTGIGFGGSGGAKTGMVEEVVLEEVGHLVAMLETGKCADATASWFGKETKRFDEEKRAYQEWAKQSLAAKQTLSEEWKSRIGGPPKRPQKSSKI